MVARAEEMARRWAIVLILDRPLAQIGDLPLEDLAREAPALCAQAIRALESDSELDRLTGAGAQTGREHSAPALRLAAIAGARDARAAVAATEALRGVLWEALLHELGWPLFEHSPAREVAELSDRLAYVCASALRATFLGSLPAEPDAPIGASRVVVASAEASTQSPETAAHPPDRTPASGQRPVIIDEHAPDSMPVPSRSVGSSAEAPASRSQPLAGRPRSWDQSPPVPSRRSEIEIRDERGEGPAAWVGSIGRQLERFEQDRQPFAVLLIEILDMERMLRDRSPAEGSMLADQVEEAIAQLRPRSGSLTRESAGRYWLLAPKTDRVEAARLAERMARAIGASTSHSGVSLEVAIGTAVCPEHGREAAALAAQADVELYAARSSAARQGASLD
jgi:GGDEF domain-containing protein